MRIKCVLNLRAACSKNLYIKANYFLKTCSIHAQEPLVVDEYYKFAVGEYSFFCCGRCMSPFAQSVLPSLLFLVDREINICSLCGLSQRLN